MKQMFDREEVEEMIDDKINQIPRPQPSQKPLYKCSAVFEPTSKNQELVDMIYNIGVRWIDTKSAKPSLSDAKVALLNEVIKVSYKGSVSPAKQIVDIAICNWQVTILIYNSETNTFSTIKQGFDELFTMTSSYTKPMN